MRALDALMQCITAEYIGMIITAAPANKAIGLAITFELFKIALLGGIVIISN